MIYVIEHHDRLLQVWREQDRRGIRLAHVDFHDDLRGLLVDRSRNRAYPIGTMARGKAPADPGNFLAHAVVEGRVAGVRWVHGEPGGRAWDMGIVRYESDWFALHHRLRHRRTGGGEIPLELDELRIEDWTGCLPGEVLSVDWDCFASILQDESGIGERVTAFLQRLGAEVPAETYLVYSPEYSRSSLEAFRALVDELAGRFEQPVKWLSPHLERGETRPSNVDAALPRDLYRRTILWLRRRGIY